jgi:hypothetical protein
MYVHFQFYVFFNVFRPFKVVFGVMFSMFGFLVFLSLLLTNVDKAINSDGPFSGYSLQVGL